MTKISNKISVLLIALFLTTACSSHVQAAQENTNLTEQVSTALSGYHDTASLKTLLELAGGDQSTLAASLIVLRQKEKPPFISIRAEKLLLELSDLPEVATVLKSDINNKNLRGLAGAITIHIDRVSDSNLRRELARDAMSRANAEKDFQPYTQGLKDSNDEEVRSIFKSRAN